LPTAVVPYVHAKLAVFISKLPFVGVTSKTKLLLTQAPSITKSNAGTKVTVPESLKLEQPDVVSVIITE